MSNKNHEPKNGYHILLDQKPLWLTEPTVTGAKLKELAGVGPEYGVWQELPGAPEDLAIGDADVVDLTSPGSEHFFTGKTATTEGAP